MQTDVTLKTSMSFNGRTSNCSVEGHSPVCVAGLSSMTDTSWSPPHMLVAAAETCFFLTLQYIADKMHLKILSYASTAEGILESPDGKHTEVKEIVIRPKIEIEGGADRAKLERLAKSAEEYCLVARSLKSKVRIEF